MPAPRSWRWPRRSARRSCRSAWARAWSIRAIPCRSDTVGGFELWDKTDLLIGIGTRLDVPIARWAPAPAGLKTARIDLDPAEHRRLSVNVAIVADAADGTRALTAAVSKKTDPARTAAIKAAKQAERAAIEKADPQYSYMKVIRDVLPDDGIVVDEVTQLGYIIWYGYPVHQPRRLISSGFSGTLGYGFPTALGVKVANPGRPVVSVTGDGGFLFGGSDLSTAKQFGINLVTVVVNNASYGNVKRDQERLYEGRHSGAVLHNPDFQAYARSFGVPAWQVETADAFRGALQARRWPAIRRRSSKSSPTSTRTIRPTSSTSPGLAEA